MTLHSTARLISAALITWGTLVLFTPSASVAADKFITIGTGGITGVYYPAGGAICRLVNRGRKDHGIRCSVESTNGSVYNLNALQENNLDLAVSQSDWQFHAFNGSSPYFNEKEPFKELRSLFSLHTEAFTIVARADSGITKLDDLVGKRVNIGDPDSGNRATMDVVMEAKGWTRDSFKLAAELGGADQPQALCDNKIDAMIYNAGHPNGAVQEVATSCDVIIIPVEGPEIDALVKNNPYYAFTEIPGGMYAGTPNNIKTFGVKATFVTTTKMDENVAYQIVKSVFDNFENFKTLHPVFGELDEKSLINEGNTAPLHRGAERYFREKGLL
jgi:TRAP transporter TAXI family solute receptor